MLDFNYEEDSRAQVDMNVVMTGDGRYVEVQGTAEDMPFSRAELDRLLALAKAGIEQIVAQQKESLAAFGLPAIRAQAACDEGRQRRLNERRPNCSR